MGQGLAACAGAGLALDEADGEAAPAAPAPGATATETLGSEEEASGAAAATTDSAQSGSPHESLGEKEAGHGVRAARSAKSQMSRQTSSQSQLSWDTPHSQLVRQVSTKTPNSLVSSVSDWAYTHHSSGSITSWVRRMRSLRKRRMQSLPEVQNFLQAHGYSDVNQLRLTCRWSASTPRRPLHLAVSRGDVAMVRLLLLHGADPALPDAAGRLPGTMSGASKGAECGWEEWGEARRAARAAAAHVLRRPQVVPEAGEQLAGGAAGAAVSDWDRLFDRQRTDPLLSRAAMAGA